MKKYAAVLLALLLTMMICVGCGNDPKDPPTPPAETDPEKTTTDLVTVRLADTNEVLLNPGKGFVYYGGSADTSRSVKYITTIGYHRFNWADIETADGVYNFEKIDKQIEYTKGQGRKFAFGVMCCNTSATDKEYITPKFVFDEGAEFDISDDGTHIQYIPKWQDPIFLREMHQFVAAPGERYNGSVDVAFIDILSYGNRGEQHLFGFHIDREGYEDLDDMYAQLIDEGVSVRRAA